MNLHNRLESRKMLPRHLPGRAGCVSRGAEPCSHCAARPESRQACFTSETASPHDRSQKRDPPQAWTCLAGGSAARSPQRVRRGGDAGPERREPRAGALLASTRPRDGRPRRLGGRFCKHCLCAFREGTRQEAAAMAEEMVPNPSTGERATGEHTALLESVGTWKPPTAKPRHADSEPWGRFPQVKS